MTIRRVFKILVVLFSLTAGGVLVWQVSQNLLGKPVMGNSVPGEENEPETPEPLSFGSKSFAFDPETMTGSGDVVINGKSVDEILNGPEGEKSDDEKKEKARPLMSGSKSLSAILEPVDPAWEAEVPPEPVDEADQTNSEKEE